jgi:hypothetical protein
VNASAQILTMAFATDAGEVLISGPPRFWDDQRRIRRIMRALGVDLDPPLSDVAWSLTVMEWLDEAIGEAA